MRINGRLPVVGLALALVALVGLTAACSDSESSTPAATTAATEAATNAETRTVNVTVTEFGIESSMTAFQAGVPYHFVVKNDGVVPHELMIVQPMEPGMMSMEEMDEMAIAVIEEDDLVAGQMHEFDITFDRPYAEGELELAWYLPGHYEAGMHTAMTVQ
ncbi:MAG: hypothetical protein O3A10_00120 [Chloroflexi bacterium]|nr:hypothetical protein [Chloroflexota bacterium]MDA1145362.1 hypothetical protein [Chloroflexota bacterium]